MATKTWEACAEQRKAEPGVWVCVTKPTPETALNPERLAYLQQRAQAVGLATEIRPLQPGKRPQGLFVAWLGV